MELENSSPYPQAPALRLRDTSSRNTPPPEMNVTTLHIFFMSFQIFDISCTLTVLCLKGGDVCVYVCIYVCTALKYFRPILDRIVANVLMIKDC
jgi:hypothetical protein